MSFLLKLSVSHRFVEPCMHNQLSLRLVGGLDTSAFYHLYFFVYTYVRAFWTNVLVEVTA
jgi:hypothetical protein